MEQEELISLVEEEMTCKSFWQLFDNNQNWALKNVIIPYIQTHLTNRDQLLDLQWALNLAEIKDEH